LKSNQQAATFATNAGVQKLKAGEVQAAIEFFERAIGLDPEHAPAHYNLGLALQKKGHLAAAKTAFERAHKLDPHFKAPRSVRAGK
jgi:Tfp pilus assembly protein PilF